MLIYFNNKIYYYVMLYIFIIYKNIFCLMLYYNITLSYISSTLSYISFYYIILCSVSKDYIIFKKVIILMEIYYFIKK